MRIECPHCHAVFEVPEAMAKGVKRLRCANCGDSWAMTGSAAAQESVPEVAPTVFEVPEEENDSKPAVVEVSSTGSEGAFLATGAMAGRNAERRSAVLHSRSAGDVQARAELEGPSMIGSAGLWVAAWGGSLVLAGSGVAALWYWKGAGVFGFLPGIGHFS
ncbi:zinc-ribbon domain-containing protein [Gluconobacter sp. OJB]|uniref:zinc-ribbon domain-containing protein n=1 Tax=Gluconobacter sp. OJB TaxID=3145196 RepID=UPI0038D191F0